MKLVRSYKYRLYPNESQRASIDHALYANRHLYNCALEERICYYSRYKQSLSYYKQAAQLPELKKEFSHMFANVYSQTLQQTLKKLDTSYSNFFRRVRGGETPGFPRFKSQRAFKSLTFPQGDLMGAGGARLLSNGNFEFFKIGEIKTILHRPFEGRCMRVLLKKQDNQYYVVMVCELEQPQVAPNSQNKSIGIDLGLKTFITCDDGTSFHHPKPYKTAKEKLAFVQRKLARKKKGSNSRRKVVKTLQKISRHVANIRNDWQHKAANQLLKMADVVCMEKLNIADMMASKKPSINVKNQNISEAAWGGFAEKLAYKAESAGKQVVFVDPRNTSRCCSNCGEIKQDLTLRDRIYNCDYCGTMIDRDMNAALNLRWRGTLQSGLLFAGLTCKQNTYEQISFYNQKKEALTSGLRLSTQAR